MAERQEFSRWDRVRKAILREMGDILTTDIKDPRLEHQVISATDIELSKDMRHAQIFISIFADEEKRNELMTLLMEYKGKIRKAIATRVQLRYAPEIELTLDTSLERGTRVTHLLDKISRGEL